MVKYPSTPSKAEWVGSLDRLLPMKDCMEVPSPSLLQALCQKRPRRKLGFSFLMPWLWYQWRPGEEPECAPQQQRNVPLPAFWSDTGGGCDSQALPLSGWNKVSSTRVSEEATWEANSAGTRSGQPAGVTRVQIVNLNFHLSWNQPEKSLTQRK